MSLRKKLVLTALLVLVTLGVFAIRDVIPTRSIVVAKDTTYFLGPLHDDGSVNYAAALNELAGAGVSPDKNAFAKLWSVWGPDPEGINGYQSTPREVTKLICDEIEIPVPPADGEYIVTLEAFLATLPPNELRTAFSGLSQNGRYASAEVHELYEIAAEPWSADKYPVLVRWLERNQEPLDLAVEASQLPKFYAPYNSDKPSAVFNWLNAPYREIARALHCRALMNLQAGQTDMAWRDIRASLRLARLMMTRPDLYFWMQAQAQYVLGVEAVATWCAHAELSQEEFDHALQDIASLPELPPIHERIHLDRIDTLVALQAFARLSPADAGKDSGYEYADSELTRGEFRTLLIWHGIQWNGLLRAANQRFDMYVDIAKMEPGVERSRKTMELSQSRRPKKELFKQAISAKGPATTKLLMELVLNDNDGHPRFLHRLLQINDELHARNRAIPLLLALARYRTLHGRYPESLEALTPQLLPELPNDSVISFQYQSDGTTMQLSRFSQDEMQLPIASFPPQ